MEKAGPIVDVRLAVGSIVEDVLRRNNQSIPTPVAGIAMIDTGATRTVINKEIVSQLNLNPVGLTSINTPSDDNVQCYEYLVRIFFPQDVIAETVAIVAPLKGQHIQCLIGRDVLLYGVFIYTGYMNTFTLSF